MEKLNIYGPKYAPVLVRIGISLVFIWFGSQQLLSPDSWTRILPVWTASLPITQVAFVYLNGWFEIIFGLMLLAGFYTRWVALLLAVHLAGITATVGYGPIGVRDFGLTISAFAIFLAGKDSCSVDNRI